MSAAPEAVSASSRESGARAAARGRVAASALIERVHTAVPGRARLRVRALYGAAPLARRIESALRAKRGVRAATASSITATVLVHYDPTCSLDEIVLALGLLALGMPAEYETAPRSGGWHAAETGQVLKALEAAPGGLASTKARERLQRFGPNALPEPGARSPLTLLAGQFRSVPVALLGASALISIGTGGIADAAAIAAVLLMNATIGFVTENHAERTIASLTGVQRRALVLRDGVAQELDARELVPGDVVLLTPGAYVPADLRLLQVRDLTVDESALTGESHPVRKRIALLDARDVPLSARANMAHMGTYVSTGSAVGVTVETGEASEIGNIQALMTESRAPETPLQVQLGRLGTQLVWVAGSICGLVFGRGILRGLGALPMLKAAISLGVAAIPEGLPTVATTTLALGVHRMRRQHALIRKLEAVETLGAVQVICLDKTGTLTANRMAVCELQVAGARVAVADHHIIHVPASSGRPLSEAIERWLETAVLCNETRITPQGSKHVLNGSGTENALVELALGSGIAVGELRRRHPILSTEHRAAGRNYMRTRHAAAAGHERIAVKGSPAEVLGMCGRHMRDGALRELTGEDRAAILAENERMAGQGLRVLGFAHAQGEPAGEVPASDLIWAGLVGMADPLREGVVELIEQLHLAGIRTVMLTGDQGATARSVGRALRISPNPSPQVLDSTQFDKLDPTLRSALAQQVDIYSRVSPAHKLQIVRAFQQAGRVVAMTGDGINDGPALRAADIGIAMGLAGTDLARSAADVVLDDDNLRTLVAAVSQGRTTYTNIRKAVHFLLATNLSEIELMLGSIALGLGQPLSPLQLLWINLVSDVFPALALAMEPAEPDVLQHPPRDPREPMIRRTDLWRYSLESTLIAAGALGSYGFGLLRHGSGARAGTLGFMTLAFAQLAHAYSCRSDSPGLFTSRRLPPNRATRTRPHVARCGRPCGHRCGSRAAIFRKRDSEDRGYV